MMKHIFHALAALLLLSGVALANTFYVATTGNDSNPGTATQPWATLQHAVDTISAGDTILVQPGTYVGCRIGSTGQAAAVKTLKANGSVVINAPGPANRHNAIVEVELFSNIVSYWVIDGFEVTSSTYHGIDIRGTTYITIQNNYAHNNASTGIFTAFSDHALVQNNISSFNGEHGIYFSNSGDYPTARSNTLHDNSNSGVHMNGDITQGGDGIISFGVIEKNVIYNNGTGGGSGINCDGVDDTIFRNNLLYNNHASGVSLYATDGAHGSSRNKVYNNTFVMASDSRWVVNIPKSGKGKPDPTGNQIQNNILYTSNTAKGSITIYGSGALNGAGSSDYNVVVNALSANGGKTTLTLTQWQALGFDIHSIIATPAQLFVDPANNNYQLKSGSPAVDAGTNLSPDVVDDINGVSRPSNGYDIGCYESF